MRHTLKALAFLAVVCIILAGAGCQGSPEGPRYDGAPVITSFTANPTTITAGQSSTLSWNVTNTQTATIDQGIGAVNLVSSKSVSPAVTTTYTLTAVNPNATATASVTITVNPTR